MIDFIFRVHKDNFRMLVPLKMTGMLKDSSKFLTEDRNIEKRDGDIFLISRPVSGFMRGVTGYLSISLIIQSG